MNLIVAVVMCLLACMGNVSAQQSDDPKPVAASTCPMHDAHAQMNERGEKGMGFSQTATTHHFYLRANGGVIQVEAIDPTDATNRDEIRMHLQHITRSFQSGDFDIPMFVHDTVPSGVPEMKKLQNEIRYAFEETASGGRVVITSANKDALAAIHSFLLFQITEHKTGDATEVR
jgi:hypothetical protein